MIIRYFASRLKWNIQQRIIVHRPQSTVHGRQIWTSNLVLLGYWQESV